MKRMSAALVSGAAIARTIKQFTRRSMSAEPKVSSFVTKQDNQDSSHSVGTGNRKSLVALESHVHADDSTSVSTVLLSKTFEGMGTRKLGRFIDRCLPSATLHVAPSLELAMKATCSRTRGCGL
jgi:hypothetical protein